MKHSKGLKLILLLVFGLSAGRLPAGPPPPQQSSASAAPAHPTILLPPPSFQEAPTLPESYSPPPPPPPPPAASQAAQAGPAMASAILPLPPVPPANLVAAQAQAQDARALLKLHRENERLLANILRTLTNHPEMGITPAQYLASPRETTAVRPGQRLAWRTEFLSNLNQLYPDPAPSPAK